MAADIESGIGLRKFDGVVERVPFAISVVAVSMPLRCASMIPEFTSRVKPKSSALTTSRFKTAPV